MRHTSTSEAPKTPTIGNPSPVVASIVTILLGVLLFALILLIPPNDTNKLDNHTDYLQNNNIATTVHQDTKTKDI